MSWFENSTLRIFYIKIMQVTHVININFFTGYYIIGLNVIPSLHINMPQSSNLKLFPISEVVILVNDILNLTRQEIRYSRFSI